MAAKSFSSNEVARMTGATLRQLQWLDEHGVVSPIRVAQAGHGGARRYSSANIKRIERIMKIRAQYRLSLESTVPLLEAKFRSVEVIDEPRVIKGVLVIPDRSSSRRKEARQHLHRSSGV